MPTYRYKCTKGHVVEIHHSIKKDALKKCTVKGCRAKAHREINFEGAIIFVGGNWTPKFY